MRDQWPVPVAEYWLAEYPQLFDADDLRLAKSQPKNHFTEWFAAIYLWHQYGALSLVEKYLFRGKDARARKARVLAEQLTTEQLTQLREIAGYRPGVSRGVRLSVQPPDLFVYVAGERFWFVEVKGPHEPVSAHQVASHQAIERLLRTHVEIIRVCPATR